MSMAPFSEPTSTDPEAEMQSDAMKDQLRKDVASWREGRAEPRQTAELSVAVAKPAAPARVRRIAKPVAVAAEPEAARKKPFGMSYDGSTTADYIKHMIARGAR